MNQTFNATPVMASSLAVSVLLNMLGSGLMTVKRIGAPFTENHYVLNDLVVNQRPSKLGQFIVLTSEDAENLQQPLEEGNSRLLLLGAESGNLVMAFDLPEEEIQQKLVPMLGNGFPLMRPFTPPQAMTNMAPPIQPWNNPAGLNPMPLQGRNDKHLLAMTGSVGSQQEVKTTPSDKPVFNMAPITVMPDYIKEAVDASVGALIGSYQPLISILRADKVFWPPVYRNTRKPILFAVLGEAGDIKGQQLTTIGVFGYEQLCEKLAKYKTIINNYLDGKIAKPTISMIVANLPQMVITQKLLNYLAATIAPLKKDNVIGATNQYGPLFYNLVDIVEITDDGIFIDLIHPPVVKGSDTDVSVATAQQNLFVREIIGYSSRTDDPTSPLPPKAEIDEFFARRPNITVKENMKRLVSALYYQYYGLCVKNGVNEETLGKIVAWVMWNSYIGPQLLWDEAPVTFDVSTPHNATEPHQAVVEVSYPYNNIRNFKDWSLRTDVVGRMHYKLFTMFSRYTNEKVKEILQGNDCYEIRQVFTRGKPTCAFKLVKV